MSNHFGTLYECKRLLMWQLTFTVQITTYMTTKQSLLKLYTHLLFCRSLTLINNQTYSIYQSSGTLQKMRFSIKHFFSKCDQIRRKLRIWSHSLQKSLIENFFFRAVNVRELVHNHTQFFSGWSSMIRIWTFAT